VSGASSPDQTCTVSVQSAPLTAGPIAGQLEVPTDNGPLDVPVTAVVASVSALQSTQLPVPVFAVSPAGDGVGSPQSLLLALSNPLSAPVSVAYVDLSGPDANRFTSSPIAAVARRWPPGRRARSPLWSHPSGVVATCRPAGGSRRTSTVGGSASRTAAGRSARTSAAGAVVTGSVMRVSSRRRGYPAALRLRADLKPGDYRVTVTPRDGHGAGRPRTISVTVGPAAPARPAARRLRRRP